MSKQSRVGSGFLLIGYTVFLIWYGLRPAPERLPDFFLWDKLNHAAAFFAGSALCLAAMGYPARTFDRCAKMGVGPVVYAAAIGGIIEILQSKVPGRHAETGDWFADLAGATAAVFVSLMVFRLKERRQHSAHQ
jgi:VanZ family protein